MQHIIKEVIQDELSAFEIEGSSLIDDLYNGRDIIHSDLKSKAEFEFLDGKQAADLLEFVKLLAGTFTLFKAVLDLKGTVPEKAVAEDTLSERWKKELIKAGLTPQKSDVIVQRFLRQLEQKVVKDI